MTRYRKGRNSVSVVLLVLLAGVSTSCTSRGSDTDGLAPEASQINLGPWAVDYTLRPVQGNSVVSIYCQGIKSCGIALKNREFADVDVVDGKVRWLRWLREAIEAVSWSANRWELLTQVCDSIGGDCRSVFEEISAKGSLKETSFLPGSDLYTAVGCTNAADCVAVGQSGQFTSVVAYTRDGGAQWVRTPRDELYGITHVSSIDCAERAECVLVGTPGTEQKLVILRSVNTGIAWVQVDIVEPVFGAQGAQVDCRGALCAVATDPAVVSSDAGRSWHGEMGSTWLLKAAPDPANSASCATIRICIAVAPQVLGDGWVWWTKDAGQLWSSVANAESIATIRCVSGTECVVVSAKGVGVVRVVSVGQ